MVARLVEEPPHPPFLDVRLTFYWSVVAEEEIFTVMRRRFTTTASSQSGYVVNTFISTRVPFVN